MCYGAVCQVGDLVPGQTFRTPRQHTLMVLDLAATDHAADGYSLCATEAGVVVKVPNETLLGRDRAGQLYINRYISPLTKPVEADAFGNPI